MSRAVAGLVPPDLEGLRLSPTRLFDSTTGTYLTRDWVPATTSYGALRVGPLGTLDPSGGVDGELLLRAIEPEKEQARLAWAEAAEAKQLLVAAIESYLGRLATIRGADEAFHVSEFKDNLLAFLRGRGASNYRFAARTGKTDASYHFVSNTLFVPRDNPSPLSCVHESIHFLDDVQNLVSQASYDEAEQLAYAAERLLLMLEQVPTLDKTLANYRRLKGENRMPPCDTLNGRNGVWRNITMVMTTSTVGAREVTHQDAYYLRFPSSPQRRIEVRFYNILRTKIGLGFSCEALRRIYQQDVDALYGHDEAGRPCCPLDCSHVSPLLGGTKGTPQCADEKGGG